VTRRAMRTSVTCCNLTGPPRSGVDSGTKTMSVRLRTRFWFLAALLAACEHGAPFRPVRYTPDGPFTPPPPPTRLTLNPGLDLAPITLPGGSGTNAILYTAERLDRADHDQCFAVLPQGGGAIVRYICRTTASDDSTNVFSEAAVAADGQLAYVRASTHRFPFRPVSPDVEALVVGTLDDPNVVRVLRTLPYTAPSGRIHQGISHVGWLGATKLVYVADSVTYPRGPPDTVRTGLEIATIDFGVPIPTVTVVAGTDSASSVAVGATGDTIYFTRLGDSRVYRRALSSGQTDTIHDFVGGIAQDVAVANGGGYLVAIVNDQPHFVNLATGADVLVADTTASFRRPVFSSDGTRVTIERWANGVVDLWLLDVP